MNALSVSRLDSQPRRILLVLPTWASDVVMATPFIRSLFAHFSQAEIHLLMHRRLLPVLEGSPWINRVHFWAPRTKTAEARAAQRELIHTLRGCDFDLAVLLPNSFRSAWLCYQAGARRRIGFARDGRGLLLTDKIAAPNRVRGGFQPMPLCDYYGALAEALGMPHPGDRVELFLVDHADAAVDARLAQAGVKPHQPLVVVSPGGEHGSAEYFAMVADQLAARFDVAIVIAPEAGDESVASAMADAMNAPACLLNAPCLSIGELKSLMADADLLLGVEGDLRQYATAFETPQVTVFGTNDPRWSAISHRLEIGLGFDGRTAGGASRSIDRKQVPTIAVEDVLAACEAQLNTVL